MEESPSIEQNIQKLSLQKSSSAVKVNDWIYFAGI